MATLNRRQAAVAIKNRQAFQGSNIRGLSSVNEGGYGRLNMEESELLRNANADYVVYSYKTPIAWHNDLGWYKVKERFSQTTSCHWGLVPSV